MAAVGVSLASLGWTIDRNLKLNRPKQESLPSEAVARRLRVEVRTMDLPSTVPPDQLSGVIDTVVQEITSRGEPSVT